MICHVALTDLECYVQNYVVNIIVFIYYVHEIKSMYTFLKNDMLLFSRITLLKILIFPQHINAYRMICLEEFRSYSQLYTSINLI